MAKVLNGHQVWVFSLATRDDASDSVLYIDTAVNDLADIWGPLWQLKASSETTVQYNIGGGSIVLWEYDPNIHPVLLHDEQLAHWLPCDMSMGMPIAWRSYDSNSGGDGSDSHKRYNAPFLESDPQVQTSSESESSESEPDEDEKLDKSVTQSQLLFAKTHYF